MTATEYVFVDTAVGGAHNRNHVQHVSKFHQNGQADVFATYRRITADFEEYTRNNTKATGKRSVGGYEGRTLARFYPLDIDVEGDLEGALQALRTVLAILRDRWGVPPEALGIYFSGCKGFSVEIPGQCFGGFDPEPVRESARRFERLLRLLFPEADELHLDPDIYDALRLWRVPNTRHGRSGLFKVRLTVEEVFSLSADQIRELARKPRRTTRPQCEPAPIPALVELWRRTAVTERAAPEQVARDGDIPEGRRHSALVRLAGAMRRHGASPRCIYAALRVFNGERCRPPERDEELRRISRSVGEYEPAQRKRELRVREVHRGR